MSGIAINVLCTYECRHCKTRFIEVYQHLYYSQDRLAARGIEATLLLREHPSLATASHTCTTEPTRVSGLGDCVAVQLAG